MTLLTRIASVLRDYSMEGVPASGAHDPEKRELRALLGEIVGAIANGGAQLPEALAADIREVASRLEDAAVSAGEAAGYAADVEAALGSALAVYGSIQAVAEAALSAARALEEIEDIAANAPDAPSVLDKLSKQKNLSELSHPALARDNLGVSWGYGSPKFPLHIPTHDGNPSTTHPDVLYFPEGFGGYSFWMVHTPFPDDLREVPEIAVSNDGVSWTRPIGAPVPLLTNEQFAAALGPDYIYNSDCDMVRLPDGRLAIYMRPVGGAFGGPFKEWLVRITSVDGRSWSPIEICAQTAVGDPIVWRSPAVVVERDGTFSMWTTGYSGGADRKVLYRSSSDGISWSAPQLCSVPGGLQAWHLDAVRTDDGVYHLLIQASGTSKLLYYWTSTDRVTFSPGCGQPASQAIPEIPGVDQKYRYRSTFQPVAGDPYRFHVWMSVVYEDGHHRIAAFLPEYSLAGVKTSNLQASAYQHRGINLIGFKDDPRSVFSGQQAAEGATGTQHTAMGELAGFGNTGLQSTHVGSRAGHSNTGIQQVAVGRQAGEKNETAGQVAVGYLAGYGNKGTNNTAVGSSAGNGNTGNNQVALGSFAGADNTAPNTTSIGAHSGAKHARSVALGTSTQTTKEDQVAIGPRNLEIQGNGLGVFLRSPDGTRYRLTVANGGALSVTAIPL